MKFPVLFLAVSLAANVVLGLLFLKSSPSAGGTGSRSTSATGSVAGPGNAAAAAGSAQEDEAWPALAGNDDLPALVERLRAGGFPPDVIRAIVLAQVSEQFSARRKALTGTPEIAPFWQTGIRSLVAIGAGRTPEDQAALSALYREQSQLAEQLLGRDAMLVDEVALASLRQNFSYLPVEKAVEFQRLNRDYSELFMQQAANASPNDPTRQEKMTLLEKEFRADLSSLLSPAELEEYDLRSSPSASMLRSRLAAFNPTEEEFRALFRVQRILEEKQGLSSAVNPMGLSSQTMQALSSGPYLTSPQGINQPEVQAELQRVLSPERFEELKLAADPAYNTITRITSRFNLPMSAAHQVVTVQRDIQQRVAQLRGDRSLSPEQRNAQLESLNQEATGKITEALGSRGLEAYREYGGAWLNTLRPPTPPTAR